MGSLTETVAAWATALDPEHLADEVVTAARRLVLDNTGVSLASSQREFGRQAARLQLPVSAGVGGSTAVGRRELLAAEDAALVNGILAHGIDFDETYQPGFVHVNAVVLPAALALGEERGASDDDLVRAIVAGYELTSRIGEAAPAAFHQYGWHATPLCGAFGAALTAALLLDLPSERVVAALGIVGSFASGIQEFLRDGTDTKRLHTGWASAAGIRAARLAAVGFDGAARILEGDFGLFATHLREGDPRDLSRITAELGTRWNILQASLKPYPCCLQMHAHVEAASRISAAGGDTDSIVGIRAYIHGTGRKILAEPDAFKRRPTTPYGAQFSLMYGVAAGLTNGGLPLDLHSFAPAALDDAHRRHLASLVEVVDDPDATYAGYRGGAVEVTYASGERVLERVAHNLGSPARPMADRDVREKFVANAQSAGLSEGTANDLADLIERGSDLTGVLRRANGLLAA